MTTPVLSPQAKMLGLEQHNTHRSARLMHHRCFRQLRMTYVLWLNSKQRMDDRLSDDGSSCTGIEGTRLAGVPSFGSKS